MAYGKTIELNNIPGPMKRHIDIRESKKQGKIVYGRIEPMFRPNQPATQNTFQGLIHFDSWIKACRDVRELGEVPIKKTKVNKAWRRLAKIGRRMRKFNTRHGNNR